jgi:ferritin-like metal-binding protein YciE
MDPTMAIFHRHHFDSMNDLLVDQLEDLYDAEKRQCESQTKLAEKAQTPELAAMFRQQDQTARAHVTRLESAFSELGMEPKRETCDAMKGLVKEAEHVMGTDGDPTVRDAALIASAQRIKHYEMAGYGVARTFAQQLGHMQIAQLMQQSLDEEKQADQQLTDLAMRRINPEAAGGSPMRSGDTLEGRRNLGQPAPDYRQQH